VGAVTVTHKRWGIIEELHRYHKKSLFNRSAEEARELARRAVAGQAKAVASPEMAQYHRHVNAHTPLAMLPLMALPMMALSSMALCLAAFRPGGGVMAFDQRQKDER
jgi:hypothetical protein